MASWRDRPVGDFLGLLESNQSEVSGEVRQVLLDELGAVKDSWLVSGLVEYFLRTNSCRMLDVLLGVREPHDRHLLDRLQDGLKGSDRLFDHYSYMALLLYIVKRNPPPMWLRKLTSHGVMRELLNVLRQACDSGETSTLMMGVGVLIILMPLLPLEMGTAYLTPILDVLARLLRWNPRHEGDESLQPMLQVVVYALFQRLYALYPCNLLSHLRQQQFAAPGQSAIFFTTLKPMMERVRFHPLLVTGSRDTELHRARWKGLETHQIIAECARLCVDPCCENEREVPFNRNVTGSNEFECQFDLPVASNWIFNSVDSFWSPSIVVGALNHAVISPAPIVPTSVPSAVPHSTAVRSLRQVAESPPETAIEATPESTPFASPIKLDSGGGSSGMVGKHPPVKFSLSAGSLGNNSHFDNSRLGGGEPGFHPVSPVKRDPTPFRFPQNHGQDLLLRAERSAILQNKLQQIQMERQVNAPDASKVDKELSCQPHHPTVGTKPPKAVVEHGISSDDNTIHHGTNQNGTTNLAVNGGTNLGLNGPEIETIARRRRKSAVFDLGSPEGELPLPRSASVDDLDLMSDAGSDYGNNTDDDLEPIAPFHPVDRRISEEKDADLNVENPSDGDKEGCKAPKEAEPIGLGMPSHKSMTDLMKSMRTNRLRFLSQCGPPPDLSLLQEAPRHHMRLSHNSGSQSGKLQRSRSCPHLTVRRSFSNPTVGRLRRESLIFPFPAEPRQMRSGLGISAVGVEAGTQTEEDVNAVNPYEELIGAVFAASHKVPVSNNKCGSHHVEICEDSHMDLSSPCPYQLLEQYLTQCYDTTSCPVSISGTIVNGTNGAVSGNAAGVIRCMYTLVQLERHQREVYAERNRKLLVCAKNVRVLEGEKLALREDVSRVSHDLDVTTQDLNVQQMSACMREKQLQATVEQLHARIAELNAELCNGRTELELLRHKCQSVELERAEATVKLDQAQALLVERNRQLAVQGRLAEDNRSLKGHVELLNKQVVLLGELQEQLQQRWWHATLHGDRQGTELTLSAAEQHIDALEVDRRHDSACLDAAQARLAQLEKELAGADKRVAECQMQVRAAAEAGGEQCRAVERRCRALALKNQTLETYVIERNHQIDQLTRQVRRSQRGKSICTDGFDLDLDLSTSPPSSDGSSCPNSPPEEGGSLCSHLPLLARPMLTLQPLDQLAELESEWEGSGMRRKN